MDCRTIESYIKPLFENRLSREESIGMKNHLLSCRECYNKLSDEYKVSLELFRLPEIKSSISSSEILESVKKRGSFNIISYRHSEGARHIDFLKTALYVILFLASLVLLFMSGDQADMKVSQQSGAYLEQDYNRNILRIERIQIVNELMPQYREASLTVKASSDSIF